MQEQYIKRADGFILGIIETKENGVQIARMFDSRLIVGFYYKNRNVTTDFSGKIISQGNSVVSLIYQNLK